MTTRPVGMPETTDTTTRSGFETSAEIRRPRVLVIDDEMSVRDFLTEALSQSDCVVDAVEDGTLAIEKASASR